MRRIYLLVLGIIIGLLSAWTLKYILLISHDPVYRGNVAVIPSLYFFTHKGEAENLPWVLNELKERIENRNLSLYETVIVLEQQSSWKVSFHLRGNGDFKKGSFLSWDVIISDSALSFEIPKRQESSIVADNEIDLQEAVPLAPDEIQAIEEFRNEFQQNIKS